MARGAYSGPRFGTKNRLKGVQFSGVTSEVLDEQYELILSHRKSKDSQIEEKLDYLAYIFSRLSKTDERPDYGNPATRFAYVYRYVTSHANFVYKLIDESKELREAIDQDALELSCIGGGPGSDLLGVLKAILTLDMEPEYLRCWIFDCERAWTDTWCDSDARLGAPFQISTVYQAVDVTERAHWRHSHKFLGSDLFTLIYFMSELCGREVESAPFFEHTLSGAQVGSLFLYIDNRGMSARFDDLVDQLGLEVLNQHSGEMSIGGLWEEQKTDLGEYYEKFGDPKMQASVDWRICRKPEEAIPF